MDHLPAPLAALGAGVDHRIALRAAAAPLGRQLATQLRRHADDIADRQLPRSSAAADRRAGKTDAVRVLAERKRWREAAERLLKLPDRYPAYAPLRENYLRAAAIHERELADSEGAARILETCVAKYPETELAKTAARELARLRGGRR